MGFPSTLRLRGLVAWAATGVAAASALALESRSAGEPRAPRIVNGVLAWDPPSVGMQLCTVGNDACVADSGAEPIDSPPLGWCSGTLVGCRTFVTAAHCVCHRGSARGCHEIVPRDPARYRVFLQHAGVFEVERVRVHPDYSFLPAESDVAVLKLTEPAPGIPPARLNLLGSPPLATPGQIVGFGQTDPALFDWGIKRSGSVVTGDCEPRYSNDGQLCWSFEEPLGPPGTDSGTCFGDSGGALFVDLGAGPVLAGVTSRSTGSSIGDPRCAPPILSQDDDVYSLRDFIAAEAGDDLGAICGDAAPVGHPRTATEGFAGRVSPAKPAVQHAFEVPPGTVVLRVGLNAVSNESVSGVPDFEFDLYVKQGSPPTLTDYDCAGARPGQFEACEVRSPTAGTWHALVQQVVGEGEYQVTFVAAPEPARALLAAAGGVVFALVGRRRRGLERSPPARPEATSCTRR